LIRQEVALETNDTIKQKWFESLLKAKNNARPTDNLGPTVGEVSTEEAYDIQAMLVEDRLQKGEHIIGWKVGATSLSIMNQLKITEPILGCMTSGSYYPLLQGLKASDFCKLAVEGEIAFIMGKNLRGPGITKADTITATAGVMGAVELVDCRIKDWKPSLTEAVADNSLHAGIILGSSMKSIIGFDLSKEGVILRKNGGLLASACGVEALGDPVNVVTWLANKLSELGREIRKGEVILTGSLTEFFFVEPGDVVDVTFTSLGNIQFVVHK
jgi:2-keto-4-pentenoate hydratase